MLVVTATLAFMIFSDVSMDSLVRCALRMISAVALRCVVGRSNVNTNKYVNSHKHMCTHTHRLFLIIAFCVAMVLSGNPSPKLSMNTASLLATCGALLGTVSAFALEKTQRFTY